MPLSENDHPVLVLENLKVPAASHPNPETAKTMLDGLSEAQRKTIRLLLLAYQSGVNAEINGKAGTVLDELDRAYFETFGVSWDDESIPGDLGNDQLLVGYIGDIGWTDRSSITDGPDDGCDFSANNNTICDGKADEEDEESPF